MTTSIGSNGPQSISKGTSNYGTQGPLRADDRCCPRFSGGRAVGCPEHGDRFRGGLAGGQLVFACGCIGSYHYPRACYDGSPDPWSWARPGSRSSSTGATDEPRSEPAGGDHPAGSLRPNDQGGPGGRSDPPGEPSGRAQGCGQGCRCGARRLVALDGGCYCGRADARPEGGSHPSREQGGGLYRCPCGCGAPFGACTGPVPAP